MTCSLGSRCVHNNLAAHVPKATQKGRFSHIMSTDIAQEMSKSILVERKSHTELETR